MSKINDGGVLIDGEILHVESDISVSTSGFTDGIHYIRLINSSGSVSYNETESEPTFSDFGIYGYTSGESFSPCVSIVYTESGEITAFRDIHRGDVIQGNHSLLMPGDVVTINTSFDVDQCVEGNSLTIETEIGNIEFDIPIDVTTNSVESSISSTFDGFGLLNNETTVTSDGIEISNLVESITVSSGKQKKIGSGVFTVIDLNYIVNTGFKHVFSFEEYSGPDAGGWDDGAWL